MIKLLLAVCVALCGVTSNLSAQTVPIDPIDGIAAVVNEDIILKSELDAAVQGILTQYKNNPEQLPPRDVIERQVLERLIMTKLQVSRADSSGIKVSDAEVDQTVSQIASQNKMDVAGLRQAVQSQGQSFDQFRRNVHDEVIVQRLQQGIIQNRTQVSDAEIDSFLKNDKRELGELEIQHILIALPDGADASQIEAARAKSEDVKNQIDQGLDFSAAAIRYSDAQHALDGGKLGWRSADQLPTAFAERAETMQKGDVSVPMRGPAGFHIIKLVDRRSAGTQLVTEYHARHILIKQSELVSSDQALAEV
ncbi:MAG: peptidylprolyl isomerase, partial [Dokdonella sp.]